MKLKGFKKSDGSIAKIYTDPTLTESDSPADAASVKAKDDLLQQGITNNANYAAGLNTRLSELENGAPSIIAPKVTEWLEDNVNPVGSAVTVDSSLTVAGSAADAKKTGDEISDLKSTTDRITYYDFVENSGLIGSNGAIIEASNAYAEVYSNLTIARNGDQFKFNVKYRIIRDLYAYYAAYNENGEFIERVTVYAAGQTWKDTLDITFTVTTQNAAYIRIGYRTHNEVTSKSFALFSSMNDISFYANINEKVLKNRLVTVYIANQGTASVEFLNSDYSCNLTLSDTLFVTLDGTRYSFSAADIQTILSSHYVSTSGNSVTINIPSGYVFCFDAINITLLIVTRNDFTSNTRYVSLLESNGKAIANGAVLAFVQKTIDSEIKNSVETIRKYSDLVYFSGQDRPTFIENGSDISVCMPPYADFRIYGRNGSAIVSTVLGDNPYKIQNLKALVFTSSNTLAIKSINSDDNRTDIILLANCDGTVSGALKPFYDLWKSQVNAVDDTIKTGNDFDCVFFSDVHKGTRNVKRIINYANLYAVDAVINGGDTVQSNMGEGLSWYNDLVDTADMDVLACVGNHDEWVSDWDTGDAKDVYDLVIAPIASKVQDLVQPSGAASSGLQYYYKDYGNVRVIVLNANTTENDTIFWNQAQLTWFENALSGAITNSKHVVCVNHAPYLAESANRIGKRWNSYQNYTDGSVSSYDYLKLDPQAISAVESFKSNGGVFVCWLTGHVHRDNLLKNGSNGTQIMINIASARFNFHPDGLHTDNEGLSLKQYYDCFNHISINTTRKMLMVKRVGFNTDYSLNIRDYFCYDYNNNVLMNEG